MPKSRIPSPARSQGGIVTPRRHPRRSRSVCSPALSTASGRLTSVIDQFKEKNIDYFLLSPLNSRRSVLTDNTDIEEPRRKSWWKNLNENSRDVMELLRDDKAPEVNNAIEDIVDIDILSQEKKNYTLDLPESSDNESINSIVLPQRRLFTQKENQPQKKFGELVGARETLAKLHKSGNNTQGDKTIAVATRELFQGTKRSKPIFPAALLNISPNKTAADKTKENIAAEPKVPVRNIFGSRPAIKRKNMFADFIVSESEDDISEIQPKIFGFQKKVEQRRISSIPKGKEQSPTSSIATDVDLDDDWQHLPSSTMVDNQLDEMVAGQTPVKRARLSKLTEDAVLIEEKTVNTSISSKSKTSPTVKEVTRNIDKTVDKTKQSNKSSVSQNKTRTSPRNKDKTVTEKQDQINSSVTKEAEEAPINQEEDDDENNFTLEYDNEDEVEMEKQDNNAQSKNQTDKISNKTITIKSDKSKVETEDKNKSPNKTVSNRSLRSNTFNKSQNEDDSNEKLKAKENEDRANLSTSKTIGNLSLRSKTFNKSQNDDDKLGKPTAEKEVNVNNSQNKTVNRSLRSNTFNQSQNNDDIISQNKSISNKSAKSDKSIADETAANNTSLNNKSSNNKSMNKSNKSLSKSKMNKTNISLNENNDSLNKSHLDNSVQKKTRLSKGAKTVEESQDTELHSAHDKVDGVENEELEINIRQDVEEEMDVNTQNNALESNVEANKGPGDGDNEIPLVDKQEEIINNTESGKHKNISVRRDVQSQDKERDNQNEVIIENNIRENENLNKSKKYIEITKTHEQKKVNKSNELKDEDEVNVSQEVDDKEEANESQEMEQDEEANVSQVVDDDEANESQEVENDDEVNESQEMEQDEEPNVSQEVEDESQEIEQDEELEAEDNASDEEEDEVNQSQGEEDDQAKESQEVENDDQVNESQEIEAEESGNEEVDEDDYANVSRAVENEDEANESQEIEAEESENEETEDANDVSQEQESEDEADVSEEVESDNYQNESQVEEENQSEAEMEDSADADKTIATDKMSEDDQEEMEVDDDQNEESNEVETENVQSEDVIEESADVTHDTTGRNRKKIKSPEVILKDKTNQDNSFIAKGRNTSIRKTKSMYKNMTIRPSLAPARDSLGLSDGTKDSSAEGSGWDSHRTTRKTLRQTFGKDFTPRKSLRALVMEKSAKQTQHIDTLHSETVKFPQANSTEYPDDSNRGVDVSVESDHELSRRTRQTTLETYLQKIKQQNIEKKMKMEEAIRSSLKAPPTRDPLSLFKVPSRPPPRKLKPASSKPKKQLKSILFEELPSEVIEDMKYKPPKRFQPANASWITKRLYKFLENKLEPKYDYKARVRAEKLVETMYQFVKECRRHHVAPAPAVDALKLELARLDVVKTHFEFYEFFHEFMPREIRIKVNPDIVNKIPMPRHGVFSDILRENTVQG